MSTDSHKSLSLLGRHPILVATVFAVLLMSLACLWRSDVALAWQRPDHPTSPTCRGPLSGRAVAVPRDQLSFGHLQGQPPLPLAANEYLLTIDDGPDPTTTPALLQVLREHCVHATFFLIGKKAAARPDLVRSIRSEGNGVGSHSMDHRNFSTMDEEAVRQDVIDGVAAVDKAATGHARAPGEWRLYRSPGGPGVPQIPPPDMFAFLKAQHLVFAGLDASPEDWRNRPPEQSLATLLPRLRDRGVILMHDGQSNTPALLPMVLDELQRRGATVVALQLGLNDDPFGGKHR